MKKSKSTKKFQNYFFLTNFLKRYFKAFPEKLFFSKKHIFVFYRNFEFNLEISSDHYSWLKEYLKVDPKTRFYDILTKIHQKVPTIPNISKVCLTLEKRMIEKEKFILIFSFRDFFCVLSVWQWKKKKDSQDQCLVVVEYIVKKRLEKFFEKIHSIDGSCAYELRQK